MRILHRIVVSKLIQQHSSIVAARNKHYKSWVDQQTPAIQVGQQTPAIQVGQQTPATQAGQHEMQQKHSMQICNM